MKTILVPTDFSSTAKNAALYAINFAKQMKYERVLLYNAYEAPLTTDPNIALIDAVDISELEKSSYANLENFRMLLKPYCDSNITLDLLSEYGAVTYDINEICKLNDVDFIVMGVTGVGKMEQTLIGSFAIDVAKRSEVPVIIVPPDATFTQVQEVMLACDFSKVVETTPVAPIKKLLDESNAKLFVVNIDHNSKHFNSDTPFQSLMLDTLLYDYKPEYQFVDDPDFV